VVGADGANGLVRRTFLGPLPKERLAMAVGWYSPGTAPMTVRFTPPPSGYLWAFPRPDHVGVGICAPLGEVPTRELLRRLEREVSRTMPALWDPEAARYAHTIPSPSADPRDILEAAGDGRSTRPDAVGYPPQYQELAAIDVGNFRLDVGPGRRVSRGKTGLRSRRPAIRGRDPEGPDAATRQSLDRRSSRRRRRRRFQRTSPRAAMPSDGFPAVVDLGQVAVVAPTQ
jgi:hypothetical protein